MQLFAELELSALLQSQRQKMLHEIQGEPANKLLNVNESDYVRYLADKFHVEPIAFEFEAMQLSHSEKMIPIEQHPFNHGARFSHSSKKAYLRQVITTHIPFSGEAVLLKCRPSSWLQWTIDVSISGNEMGFEIINWQDEREQFKAGHASTVENMRRQSETVAKDTQHFNTQLEAEARQAVMDRKTTLLKQSSFVESLGIPLRRTSNIPKTFSIPVAPKRIIVKPASSASAHSPDPTLDDSEYQNILSIIHDAGVGMERLPSTYSHKQEEDLRDYLLIPLCTHYPNSTGETFNKSGKTDILIRHEGSNAFVGECKFWKGIKAFHETIDQILSYLTWRDSKAAILCFVNNKELNPVLEQIATGTPQHPCFVRLESKKQESWVQYEFRLKSDPTRNLHLAILCFHFPPC